MRGYDPVAVDTFFSGTSLSNAEELLARRFPMRWLGYSEDEVDAALDAMAERKRDSSVG